MQLYQKIWQGTSSAFSQSENHGWHHQPFINDVMSSMTKMMMRTCDHSWTWQSLWLATMTWHTTILHTLFSYDIQNLHTSKSSWQTGMWIRAIAAHQHRLLFQPKHLQLLLPPLLKHHCLQKIYQPTRHVWQAWQVQALDPWIDQQHAAANNEIPESVEDKMLDFGEPMMRDLPDVDLSTR